MVTDTQRVRRADPGDPEQCVAFNLHRIYVPQDKLDEIVPACKKAEIGCVDCKKILTQCLNERLAPFRSRREELAQDAGFVDDLLADGSRRASAEAVKTMQEVRSALRV